MVVPNKNGKLKICVDFRKINVVTKKDPYSLPFMNEVLKIVHEVYTYLHGFHDINLIEGPAQNCFCNKLGAFVWVVVIPLGVKNGSPIY
jgi:hypothetical protein